MNPPGFLRSLSLFDFTMIVMGSIIGTSIFVVPQVVARDVPGQGLMLGAWVLGGVYALSGAFIAAELAWRRPLVGGTYAYLRDAYHPSVAFIYGWCLLLVVQSGSMASVAMIFARYSNDLAQSHISEGLITTVVIAFLTSINCLGIRTGSAVQNVLMSLKILVFAALIVCGLAWGGRGSVSSAHSQPLAGGWDSVAGLGAAMVPVLFAYGGWQMAAFIAAEVREPQKTLPRGMVLGVVGVIALYLGVSFVCARTLGDSLARTPAPASAVMRLALGERGAAVIAMGIAISAVGYLSQATLTTPRVYYAMAADGLFFKSVAWLHPRTHVPIVAILMQGAFAILIALSGKYHEVLNYVMSVDMVFSALTAGSLFVFRRRDAKVSDGTARHVPGHPVTTIFFIALSAAVALSLFYKRPGNAAIGVAIALAGIPVYFFWQARKSDPVDAPRSLVT